MARNDPDSVVTTSILDRLIDREPKSSVEPAPTRAQSIRALKSSLRRDLEWLLNTRQIVDYQQADFPELGHSLYYYGLPDITTLSYSNPKDRNRLLRSLEAAVRNFEPRLDAVKVIPVETGTEGPSRRILRFQIEGLLKMDPAPEQVSFDTVLQLTSGEYEVKGERSA